MKKSNNVLLIIGSVLLLIGISICVFTITQNGFDLKEISTAKRDEKTYNVKEKIDSIDISAVYDDVEFIISNEKFKVEYYDSENLPCAVKTENGVLKIKQKSKKGFFKFFNISFDFSNQSIKIFIPSNYSGLDEIKLSSVSGSADLGSLRNLKKLNISTVSGDADIEEIEADEISVMTVSGDIEINNIKSKNVILATTSGEIEANRLYVDTLDIESVSGSIGLDDSDADKITISTISGNINGVLASEKNFKCNTISGRIDVPDSNSAKGSCTASTTSGDIRFSISKGK